ncbi:MULTISPECIES: DUF3618 domain-containing protein [unclassified Gordonia (in: high G+C Gram-positive bacteria)]
MAGDTDRIEQDIVQAREDLANTLDTLAERVSPDRLASDAKSTVKAFLGKPAVKYSLAAAGALVVVVVVRKIVA